MYIKLLFYNNVYSIVISSIYCWQNYFYLSFIGHDHMLMKSLKALQSLQEKRSKPLL